MINIKVDLYTRYTKIECYSNVDELVFESVLVSHTDKEIKDTINFMNPRYHRVRVTTSEIVQ